MAYRGPQADCSPNPASKRCQGVREFLGSAGFCRLWIPEFAEMAVPLTPHRGKYPFHLEGDKQQQVFDQIKRALLSAPALCLPDMTKHLIC